MAGPNDPLDSWIENIEAPTSQETERWEENFITLATKQDLDLKILEVGDMPRSMAPISDESGAILVQKYDLLSKPIWQRLRSRTDVPELFFVCERPIRVVEQFNLEFFNYEDYQYLGAWLAEKGRNKSAGILFNEALKSEWADAYINKGVYHYRSGSTGVFDNFRLAKKHFEKGIGIVHKMKLGPADENRRRKLCRNAVDEIEFKTSRGLSKFFKTIVRLLSFHFEKDIFYVGPADKKSLENAETLKLIEDAMAKYELQMMKESMESFIYQMKLNIPQGSEDAAMTLDGMLNQIRELKGEKEMVELSRVLSGIFVSLRRADDRLQKAKEQTQREAQISLVDRMTTEENAQVKRLESVYSLKSPRELADMAERKDIDPLFVLWLYSTLR